MTKPNQVWVGDITYLKVAHSWRYLAIVMDQYSRRILAWTLTPQRTTAVTCAVLAEAARRRPARSVIFHSDRGSAFATEHALRIQLQRYIRYYNTIRLHSSLNYTSPLAFEQRVA